jgi:hypothetical protein
MVSCAQDWGIGMLSAVIATENAERILVPTLIALVPGATGGLVREVILADAGSSDATATIADAAGCRVVATPGRLGDRLRAAAAQARAPWLLFLRPGVVLDSTWIEETRRFIEGAEFGGRANARAALFRAPGAPDTLPTIVRILARMAAALHLRGQRQQGLLIAKQLYEQLGGHRGDAADAEASLLRRLGRQRLVLLRSQTRLAGDS